MNLMGLTAIAIVALVLIVVAVFVVVGIAIPLARALAWFFGQLGRFVVGEITDALRFVGALLTAIILVPLTLACVLIGRWSAAAHFGRAIQDELLTMGACLYRILIGHPIALFALTPLTDGIQQRLPQVVRAAPGRDKPPRRVGQFEGYTIVGSLKGGGSGGKLYIARPDEIRKAAFSRQGYHDIDQVVIKAFSLKDGSTLPQIIRESRALDAARKLGLVLDHELTNERFYYVMRYVPGESLAQVTQRLHAISGDAGLDDASLRRVISFTQEVLRTLRVYHQGGLWHKDIKPDNIIVEGDRASVVDLGLVTPLRSNMTLTTHGTEYFRDPELVRLALKGVKVHQVDGAKFDIYAAGAVLYSAIENSFPAHGVLSQVKKRCPEAIKWIIRRAMADYDQRYESVDEMLADLETVARADDPFKVRPADLPSMRPGVRIATDPEPREPTRVSPVPEPSPAAAALKSEDAGDWRERPRIRVRRWLTGAFEVEGKERVRVAARHTPRPPRAAESRPTVPQALRPTAREQLARAHARAAAARARAAQKRKTRHLPTHAAYSNGPNVGVGIATLVLIAVVVGIILTRQPAQSTATAVATDVAATPELRLQPFAIEGTPVPVVPRSTGPLPDPIEPEPAEQAPIVAPGVARTAGLAAMGLNIAVEQQLRGSRVLFVNDTRPPYAPRTDRLIRTRLEALRALGLTLVDSPLGLPDDDPQDLPVEDLVARLHLLRAGRNLDSKALADDIAAWIEQTPGVDFVVWIEPNPLAEDDVLIELFSPHARGNDLNAPLRLLANYTVEQVVRPKRS